MAEDGSYNEEPAVARDSGEHNLAMAIGQLEGRVSSIETGLSDLRKESSGIAEKAVDTNTRVQVMGSQIQTMTEALAKDQEAQDRRISEHSDEIDNMRVEVAEMKQPGTGAYASKKRHRPETVGEFFGDKAKKALGIAVTGAMVAGIGWLGWLAFGNRGKPVDFEQQMQAAIERALEKQSAAAATDPE